VQVSSDFRQYLLPPQNYGLKGQSTTFWMFLISHSSRNYDFVFKKKDVQQILRCIPPNTVKLDSFQTCNFCLPVEFHRPAAEVSTRPSSIVLPANVLPSKNFLRGGYGTRAGKCYGDLA
jgi:hypothetical protein